MKVTYLFAAPLTVLSVASAEPTDPADPFEWPRIAAVNSEWPACLVKLDAVLHNAEAHVDGNSRVGELTGSAGKLAMGTNPTAKALRAECLAQAKASPDRERDWKLILKTDVYRLKVTNEHPGPEDYYAAGLDAANCAASLDRATEVLGNATFTFVGTGTPEWTGTLATAKTEICAPAQKAAEALKAARFEPFIKAGIKHDKLKMLDADHLQHPLGVPGGTFTLDPAALAKATAWFTVGKAPDCPEHKAGKHVHRFEFDADGKLVKETVAEYCGGDPERTFK